MRIQGRLGYHGGNAQPGPDSLVVPLAAFTRVSLTRQRKAGLSTALTKSHKMPNIIRYLRVSSFAVDSTIIIGEHGLP